MNNDELERVHAELGHTAPRVTLASIEAKIASEHYINVGETLFKAFKPESNERSSLGLMTICVLEMKNGFVVVGKSACASPENFNAELGAKLARDNAIQQLWQLEGYLLKEKLSSNH